MTAEDTALTAARQEGAQEANARIAAIVAADGVKGAPSRVAAALNLAIKSPAMSADDVVAFVTESIPADAPKAAASIASLANRTVTDPVTGARSSAEGGSIGVGGADQSGWASAVKSANARFGEDAA
jgi:hypothetical protein